MEICHLNLTHDTLSTFCEWNNKTQKHAPTKKVVDPKRRLPFLNGQPFFVGVCMYVYGREN